MTATFGDLIRTGGHHLDRAFSQWRLDLTAETAAAMLRGIHRIAQIMARYATDIADSQAEHPGPTAWRQAAAAARSALETADPQIQRDLSRMGRLGEKAATQGAGVHINYAADSLAAARDLLHTHRVLDHPTHHVFSDWSEIIDSTELAGALLAEIGQWTRLMAIWLPHVHATDLARSRRCNHVHDSLGHGLWTATAAIERASKQTQVSEAASKLLHGIPAALPPIRNPPRGKETIDELCTQARISAQRARRAVRLAATQAHWSPQTSADSWQWQAEAAAILSHLTSLLLTRLGQHRELTRWFPASPLHLHAATHGLTHAHLAWQRAASAWDIVTTDTRGHGCPAILELSDLLLRIGRLTYDNPLWTPARAQRAALREPTELAHTPSRAQAVAAAVHETTDTLACLAAADRQAIELANRVERLHVPTRCLPARYDIPRPFGPAMPLHVVAVTDTYDMTIAVSNTAARTLEELALCLDAPSASLALARSISRSTYPGRSTTPEYAVPPPPRSVRHESVLSESPEHNIPGPVETELLHLGVTDPFTLLQAAAIDQTRRELISRARKDSGGISRMQPAKQTSLTTRGPVDEAGWGVPLPQLRSSSHRGPGQDMTRGISPGVAN